MGAFGRHLVRLLESGLSRRSVEIGRSGSTREVEYDAHYLAGGLLYGLVQPVDFIRHLILSFGIAYNLVKLQAPESAGPTLARTSAL